MVEHFEVSPSASVSFEAGAPIDDRATLWSGAQAFRVRAQRDRVSTAWSVEGCVGTLDHDHHGDAMRFDPASLALRELHLNRPRSVRVDEALLARIAATPFERGSLRLTPESAAFALSPVDVALFDTSLGIFVGLREVALEALSRGGGSLRAIAASPHVALLFFEGAYVGWAVDDPIAHARPMGWPEARDALPLDAASRGALASLLYDWMVIDAAPRVQPAETSDPDEVAHLVALRDRARALSEAGGDANDPLPGVARDVAAHAHWSWGFFRVVEAVIPPGAGLR